MNIFQLECFLAVAESLSFARASERLHVTQPAVTGQIHSLEKELGVKLFNRTTRSVKMTEEGRVFFDDARNIVMLSRRAAGRFQFSNGSDIRLLTLGCHSYSHLFLLTDSLRQLAEKFPDIHPRLRVVPFQHLYRMLEENDLDAVIGFQEPESGKAKNYVEITAAPIVCVCSPAHPLSGRERITIEDLEQENLILFDPMRTPASIARLQSQLMGGRDPSHFYFCESAEAVMVLVQAGFGIALLPDFFIPPSPDLKSVSIDRAPFASFGIYYNSLEGNEALKYLVKLLSSSGLHAQH